MPLTRESAIHSYHNSTCALGTVAVAFCVAAHAAAAAASAPTDNGATLTQLTNPLIEAHPGRSGAYVLEKGEDALMARAWLTDHAASRIDVQYFIWSNDNVGILATEALLTAAERGVRIRVIVDDLLVDAPRETLLALAAHPRIDIRIYNPQHSVGTSKLKRLFNTIVDFRAVNLRMHDKTFIVDDLAAITGGRNMADEYFDYNQHYNFRDRDILLLGPVVASMTTSFERFWDSEWVVSVESLLPKEKAQLTHNRIVEIYEELHRYARDPSNLPLNVRNAITNLTPKAVLLLDKMIWDEVTFICDMPGKNSQQRGLKGGSNTTTLMVDAISRARKRITIQSPYLILPDGGLRLFRDLIDRGVQIRINTNSLEATDNIVAFSGYSKQRQELLDAGVEIYEYRPDPEIRQRLIDRYPEIAESSPIFAIHAKTLVIDGETLYIGTFNLDPRSANLNTEVGVFVNNTTLAGEVEQRIEADMLPENSWYARDRAPASKSPPLKRLRLRFLKMLPLKDIL